VYKPQFFYIYVQVKPHDCDIPVCVNVPVKPHGRRRYYDIPVCVDVQVKSHGRRCRPRCLAETGWKKDMADVLTDSASEKSSAGNNTLLRRQLATYWF